MFKTLTTSLMALVAVGLLAGHGVGPVHHGQGQGRGQGGQARPGATVAVEFKGGVEPEVPDQDRPHGEFVQLLTESGEYLVTVTAEGVGPQSAPVRVRLGAGRRRQHRPRPGRGRCATPRPPKSRRCSRRAWPPAGPATTTRAIAKFNEAATVIPNCADCYYNIGVSYMAKKDEKQAEEAWKKALELKPDNAEAASALATLYNNQKRFDEAAAMSAKAAAAAAPGAARADAVYNQGIILWNQGKIAEAKTKFEEALKADPNYADAHYQLGMALLNEGKLPDAVAAFEKYLSLAPTGQFADAGQGDGGAAEEIVA